MPSQSKAQFRFMRAVEHNPSFARKVNVPPSVGRKFSQADKTGHVLYDMLPAHAAASKKKKR